MINLFISAVASFTIERKLSQKVVNNEPTSKPEHQQSNVKSHQTLEQLLSNC